MIKVQIPVVILSFSFLSRVSRHLIHFIELDLDSLKAMPHVTISSMMAFNVVKIASSVGIVTKSSTISLRVAGL